MANEAITNRSMPPSTIIPELAYRDVRAAVAWLCATFGFRERLRIGEHRSQLSFSDATIIVMAQSAQGAARSPDVAEYQSPQDGVTHAIMVRVADVDRHYLQAKQCGAQILSSPTDFPYGERQYTVCDLADHHWTFSQSIADVDPPTWGGLLIESSK